MPPPLLDAAGKLLPGVGSKVLEHHHVEFPVVGVEKLPHFLRRAAQHPGHDEQVVVVQVFRHHVDGSVEIGSIRTSKTIGSVALRAKAFKAASSFSTAMKLQWSEHGSACSRPICKSTFPGRCRCPSRGRRRGQLPGQRFRRHRAVAALLGVAVGQQQRLQADPVFRRQVLQRLHHAGVHQGVAAGDILRRAGLAPQDRGDKGVQHVKHARQVVIQADLPCRRSAGMSISVRVLPELRPSPPIEQSKSVQPLR